MTPVALISVPLLLGCDILKMDKFMLSLLKKNEVIAVNQDSLGKQAMIISIKNDTNI